jgi:hypothetical protein
MKTLAQPRDKAEILQRLRTVRAESARRWGRMTAPQMVCHLGDSFRMVIGQRPVSQAAVPVPRPLIKWVALYLPLPWPHGIRTRPEIDQCKGGGTQPADFGEDIAQLEALLDLVTAATRTFAWPRHPLFGAMSTADWLRWGYLHMDHHFRQFGA